MTLVNPFFQPDTPQPGETGADKLANKARDLLRADAQEIPGTTKTALAPNASDAPPASVDQPSQSHPGYPPALSITGDGPAAQKANAPDNQPAGQSNERAQLALAGQPNSEVPALQHQAPLSGSITPIEAGQTNQTETAANRPSAAVENPALPTQALSASPKLPKSAISAQTAGTPQMDTGAVATRPAPNQIGADRTAILERQATTALEKPAAARESNPPIVQSAPPTPEIPTATTEPGAAHGAPIETALPAVPPGKGNTTTVARFEPPAEASHAVTATPKLDETSGTPLGRVLSTPADPVVATQQPPTVLKPRDRVTVAAPPPPQANDIRIAAQSPSTVEPMAEKNPPDSPSLVAAVSTRSAELPKAAVTADPKSTTTLATDANQTRIAAATLSDTQPVGQRLNDGAPHTVATVTPALERLATLNTSDATEKLPAGSRLEAAPSVGVNTPAETGKVEPRMTAFATPSGTTASDTATSKLDQPLPTTTLASNFPTEPNLPKGLAAAQQIADVHAHQTNPEPLRYPVGYSTLAQTTAPEPIKSALPSARSFNSFARSSVVEENVGKPLETHPMPTQPEVRTIAKMLEAHQSAYDTPAQNLLSGKSAVTGGDLRSLNKQIVDSEPKPTNRLLDQTQAIGDNKVFGSAQGRLLARKSEISTADPIKANITPGQFPLGMESAHEIAGNGKAKGEIVGHRAFVDHQMLTSKGKVKEVNDKSEKDQSEARNTNQSQGAMRSGLNLPTSSPVPQNPNPSDPQHAQPHTGSAHTPNTTTALPNVSVSPDPAVTVHGTTVISSHSVKTHGTNQVTLTIPINSHEFQLNNSGASLGSQHGGSHHAISVVPSNLLGLSFDTPIGDLSFSYNFGLNGHSGFGLGFDTSFNPGHRPTDITVDGGLKGGSVTVGFGIPFLGGTQITFGNGGQVAAQLNPAFLNPGISLGLGNAAGAPNPVNFGNNMPSVIPSNSNSITVASSPPTNSMVENPPSSQSNSASTSVPIIGPGISDTAFGVSPSNPVYENNLGIVPSLNNSYTAPNYVNNVYVPQSGVDNSSYQPPYSNSYDPGIPQVSPIQSDAIHPISSAQSGNSPSAKAPQATNSPSFGNGATQPSAWPIQSDPLAASSSSNASNNPSANIPPTDPANNQGTPWLTGGIHYHDNSNSAQAPTKAPRLTDILSGSTRKGDIPDQIAAATPIPIRQDADDLLGWGAVTSRIDSSPDSLGDTAQPASDKGLNHTEAMNGDVANTYGNGSSKPNTLQDETSKLAALFVLQDDKTKRDNKPELYQVQPGDTLSKIAATKLNDATLAILIYELNRSKIRIQQWDEGTFYKLVPYSILLLPCPRQIRNWKMSQSKTSTFKSLLVDNRRPISAETEATTDKEKLRRANIEKFLGSLDTSKKSVDSTKVNVRFGDTLRSISLKHPALKDACLWPLLAQINGLSTETDSNGIPLAKLERGACLVLPTREQIHDYEISPSTVKLRR